MGEASTSTQPRHTHSGQPSSTWRREEESHDKGQAAEQPHFLPSQTNNAAADNISTHFSSSIFFLLFHLFFFLLYMCLIYFSNRASDLNLHYLFLQWSNLVLTDFFCKMLISPHLNGSLEITTGDAVSLVFFSISSSLRRTCCVPS